MSFSDRYRVRLRVQGDPGPRWSEVVGDVVVESGQDGTSVIRATVRDQAALYGLLAAVRDQGLALISVLAAAAPESTSNRPRPARTIGR